MNKIKLLLFSFLVLIFIFSSAIAKAAPADAVGVFDLTTVSGSNVMGYSGGYVGKAPDVFNACKNFVNTLKTKANDYYVVINGKEFKVGSYNIMYTPSYDFDNVKTDGYNINLFVSKNKKTDNNYLYLDCSAFNNSVNFAFVGNQFGEKIENDPGTEYSLFIFSNDKKLKKISTKGTYAQGGYNGGWGGYTYTTPWKSVFNNLDKKLVSVSELAYQEPKTFVSEYKIGGFGNYTTCLKSDKPFCFKKSGNKLVMFSRVGWGSKVVDFWVK